MEKRADLRVVLCLLLRSNFLWLAAAGAGAAIGSKFLLRWRSRCEAAKQYLAKLPERRREEATTLEGLTGWALPDIHKQMGLPADGLIAAAGETKWYQKIWGK